MPTAPTKYITIPGASGQPNYAALAYEDVNGGFATITTPWYISSGGVLLPAPVDANGNPQVAVTGSNATLGNYSLAFASGATTAITQAVPLPATPQNDALYLVSISNPSGLGVSVSVEFDNTVNFGSGNVESAVTAVDVASGVNKSYLVQGWLLGDAAAQIKATPDVATMAAGSLLVQVRKV